ncbi:MAG: hypothetical protein LBS90_02155 [Oscillospiraceae bacterium]|jgi:hypothetical protein|nr:hypothetical protein [Oscillospiraceae bacterium]
MLKNLRKKIIAAAVCAAVVLAVPFSRAGASQFACFTAVDDTLLPLSSLYLPAYSDAVLYLPGTVFKYAGLSVDYRIPTREYVVSLGSWSLSFYTRGGGSYDHNGAFYPDSAISVNGIFFIPADFVCGFFGLKCSVTPASPLSVVRIKTGGEIFNDPTFISRNRAELQRMYDEYMYVPVKTATPALRPSASPTAAPSAPASPGASPGKPSPTPAPPDYTRASVSVSAYSLGSENALAALELFDRYGITGCFYFTETEAAANPALVRRIYGSGHSVGVWLETPSYDEYRSAAKSLFDAARIKTQLAAAPPELYADLYALAADRGLSVRRQTVFHSSDRLADRLPGDSAAETELLLDCAGLGAEGLNAVASLVASRGYTLKAVREKNVG